SATAWPERSDPFADWINGVQKYVVSDTLSAADVKAWSPTSIIRTANLMPEIASLRERPGGDVYVYGSVTLAQALLAAGFVDELVLMVEPITLGGGKTLF